MQCTCTISGVNLIFFNDTATTEIYTLSLHDALPISWPLRSVPSCRVSPMCWMNLPLVCTSATTTGSSKHCKRSEEHTSELQSRQYLVCRLLLEKKNKTATSFGRATAAPKLKLQCSHL